MRKISLIAAAVAMTASSVYADIQIGKGLTVGGYLDATYKNVDNETTPDSAGFSAQNAEIDFKMDFSKGLTARVDLDSSLAGTVNAVVVEQARIDYAFGQSTLTIGKFDTFIGLEGLEAPDLYQISNSLTFALEPTQHEGLSYAYNGGSWNLAVALVNGIGSNNGNGNNTVGVATEKDSLAYAFHLGLKPTDALSFNVNYAMGDDEVGASLAGAVDAKLWTVDASYSNHGWTLGAEYVNLDEDTGVTNIDTNAWMGMVNYMFTEQFGLTGRVSKSAADSTTVGAQKTKTSEYALAGTYAFTPNWSGLLEYQKIDRQNGNTNTDTIAFETILTF